MDLTLKQNELISFGLKRLALEQVESAMSYLKADKAQYDEAVHSVRKNFKKIRAILRLVRFDMGEKNFKSENYCYRDIGRKLSDLRDSSVLIESINKLSDELNDESFHPIKIELEEKHQELIKNKLEDQKQFEIIADELNEAKGRIYDWSFHGESFDILYEGLKNIYEKGRFYMLLITEQQTPHNYHEWRKKVKYLWYSVRILMNSWENHLCSLADSLKNLSDLLGDANDLNELKKFIVLHPEIFTDAERNNNLITFIDEKINQLNVRSNYLGARIYSEDPPEFANRLRSYYSIWINENKTI